MRALTVHNPFAHLIMTPQEELPPGAYRKRVENRTWNTHVRGQLAIHAGMSLKWFGGGDWPHVPDREKLSMFDFPQMPFGEIVGVVDLIHCFSIEDIKRGAIPTELMWLQSHEHTEGPFCFVLSNIRRLKPSVVCTGKQGFWTVPDEAARDIEYQISRMPAARRGARDSR